MRSSTLNDATSVPANIAAEAAARQAALNATCAEWFPEPTALIFEVGCGHGHFLAAYAAAHPAARCLGVDIASARIARAQRKQNRLGLARLSFLKADALETLYALPRQVKLAGIFVLFPDPWPKQRHHRRRLLQPELLDALATRAAPDAWLAVRTDHPDYFDWARAQIAAHAQWRLAPELSWPFEHSTVFQEMHGPHQSLMAARR